MAFIVEQIEKQISQLSLQEQLYLMEKLAHNLRKKTTLTEVGKEGVFAGGLGGIWQGVEFSEKDIEEARREMWGNFGEKE